MVRFSGKLTQILWLLLSGVSAPCLSWAQACLPPSQQTYFLVPDSIRTDSVLISWMPGNGDGRVLFISQQNYFVAPTPGTIPSPSTTYQGGQQCVYDGNGSGPLWIGGLQPNTIYYVAGFEYCLPDRLYFDTVALLNPAAFITAALPCSVPTVQASNIGLVQLGFYGVQFYFSQGDGSGRAVFLSDGPPASVPQNGSQLLGDTAFQGGVQCVYFGPGSPTLSLSGLQDGTNYSIRIFEYCGNSPLYLADSSLGNPFYFSTPVDSIQAPCEAPTSGVSGLSAAWLGGDSIQVNWQAGSGDGQLILLGSSTPLFPPVNGQAPPQSSTQYQGNPTAVYSGPLSGPASVQGLTPGTYFLSGYGYCLPDYNYDLLGMQTAPIQVVVGAQGLNPAKMEPQLLSNPVPGAAWELKLGELERQDIEFKLHSMQGKDLPVAFEASPGGLRWVGEVLTAGMYVLNWKTREGRFGRLPVLVSGQ
jgi:hypothetical protein